MRKLCFGFFWLLFIGLTFIIFLDIIEEGFTILKGVILLFCLVLSGLGFYNKKKYGIIIVIVICLTGSLLFIVELSLQFMAAIGKFPPVAIHDHIPYGRVYNMHEGGGNGIMNRYGWFYPAFKTEKKSKRVALIGDDFIEALQIVPRQHLGVELQRLVNEESKICPITEFIAFGISGIGPAQYYELIKYAKEYFDVDEVILFMFLGNDFSDTLWGPYKNYEPPDKYIYYEINKKDELQLRPESEKALKQFNNKLKTNIQSPFSQINRLLKNHCMTLTFLKYYMKAQKEQGGAANNQSAKRSHINIVPDHFALYANVESVRAELVTMKVLEKCYQYTQEKKIRLRIVTIPHFPPQFFDAFPDGCGTWSLQFNNFDFIRHENILELFCKNRKISYLPMGTIMEKFDHTLIVDIKKYYYLNGVGHLTPEGHLYFADQIFKAFYEY